MAYSGNKLKDNDGLFLEQEELALLGIPYFCCCLDFQEFCSIFTLLCVHIIILGFCHVKLNEVDLKSYHKPEFD